MGHQVSVGGVGGGPQPVVGQHAAVRVALLGGFGVRHHGQPLALHPGAQRLVAFLALHDRPVSRAHVAAALWLDASEGRCSANLRSALWRLRKVGVPLILSDRAGMRLASGVEVDTRAVRAGAQRLLETPTHDGLDAEVALLASELLPDWYDDWVVVERERFRQLALHALEALADRLTAAGRHGHAVQAALAAVQLEPLRESSRRALIRAHLSEGNVSEALRESEPTAPCCTGNWASIPRRSSGLCSPPCDPDDGGSRLGTGRWSLSRRDLRPLAVTPSTGSVTVDRQPRRRGA